MKTSKLTFTLFVIIGLIILSCDKNDNATKDRPIFTLEQADFFSYEEYEIYSLAINEFYSTEQVVIYQKTSHIIFLFSENFNEILVDRNPVFDTTIYMNYNSVNDSFYFFDDKFTSDDKQIILMSPSEFQYIFYGGFAIFEDWKEFYKEYPNSCGLIELTRIGFNDTYTQAVFEIRREHADLQGVGRLVYLVKVGNNWEIRDWIDTWMA